MPVSIGPVTPSGCAPGSGERDGAERRPDRAVADQHPRRAVAGDLQRRKLRRAVVVAVAEAREAREARIRRAIVFGTKIASAIREQEPE